MKLKCNHCDRPLDEYWGQDVIRCPGCGAKHYKAIVTYTEKSK